MPPWGSNGRSLSKIQHLQNWAARIATQNYDFINTRGLDLVKDLGWQTFEQRRDYLSANLMYKCMNSLAPHYLSDNIISINDMTNRQTRSCRSHNVYTSKPNIEKYKESFQYRGGLIWNNLEWESQKGRQYEHL